MRKIHGLLSVLVLAAEDETAIIGQVTYNEGKDEVLGFCGVNGDHHYQCLDSFCVPVGDGEEGYKGRSHKLLSWIPSTQNYLANLC